MATDHDAVRYWTAAYVLGVLDPHERVELEAHAASCEACRADIAALAPLPSLLARVDRAELGEGIEASLAESIAARARGELGRLRTSRQRWRLAAVGGAAAAVAMLAWIFTLRDGGEGGPAGESVAIEESAAAGASLRASSWGWGTEISVALHGLPARDSYQLWAVDESGTWHLAATWGPTESGDVRLTGATAAPLQSLVRFYVTSPAKEDVLVEAVV
jgi:anti-sigma-K factor RskA